VTEGGCTVAYVLNRDSARLRRAIGGSNMTDVIDAGLLA
jgi:hypothetical protein